MSSSEPLLLYVILGAAGSGRRTILSDLIADGLSEEERAVVLVSQNEAETNPDEEKKLGRTILWSLREGFLSFDVDAIGDATHLFFLTDGRSDPTDQLEAFKTWADSSGGEIARVISIVNCQLASKHPELAAWYEACIHFSDVVLLNKREGVENKWLSDFQTRFKSQFFPCLFEFVKNGKVKNPPLVLEPQARRVSHLFDEVEWEVVDNEGETSDAEDADDAFFDDDEGEFAKGDTVEEEVELRPVVDPYLERNAAGRRVKPLPTIAKYLDEEAP
jgi:hypothetical protein